MSKTRLVNLFASSYDAYVGSPSDGTDPRQVPPGAPGFLGNPFEDGTSEDNLIRFRHYFLDRVSHDRRFRLAVLSLYGRRLGCICEQPDENCHGTVIVEWLENHHREYRQQFEIPPALQPA